MPVTPVCGLLPGPLSPPESTAGRLRCLTFQSPVGDWRMWLWTPAGDLAAAVTGLWATSAETLPFREKVVPRETVELMINFGGRQTVHWDGPPARTQHFRRAWVSGLQTACLDIESPTSAQLIVASLHPAHAASLLGVAGHELCGHVVALDEVLARTARDLADRLEETASVAGRFLLFEDFLRDRQRRARPVVPAVNRAVGRILASGGQLSATELRTELGCSARYLEKRLAEQVGLSPKQLSRLVRFSRAIERLRHAAEVRWADLAADCGYFDQPHFNREFRRFTGVSPGEFLAQRDPSSQALLLD